MQPPPARPARARAAVGHRGLPLPPRGRIILPMRAVSWCFLVGLALALQPAASQDPTAKADPSPQRMLVDTVVATVNDSTILQSELFTSAQGTIRTTLQRFGPLSPRDLNVLINRELDALIDRRCMAQAAKTLGPLTPEQVDQVVRAELERSKQEQVRDLGSLIALSQELERQGRTWQTAEREQKIETLYDLADELSVRRRLQKQQNLYLTPRMLRETYNANKHLFVHPARAQVGLVLFRGATAGADAEAAAKLWQEQALTSRELAERFPGATALDNMLARSLRPELAEFARQGPAGAVSRPFAHDGMVELAKVLEFVPARDGRFEDPAVQEDVRNLCHQRVVAEFRAQAMERARQRTEVWRYRDGRRLPGR